METQYTVGELAKRMKVSVRTLQYYDQWGLLTPSGYTEGGRRLYGTKDILRLQQILSLKYLGLSLDEIRELASDLSDAREVGKMLEEQMRTLEKQIDGLQRALVSIRAVHKELGEKKDVDFTRIAGIIIASRLSEDGYWWEDTMFKNQPGLEMKGIIQQRAEQDQQFGLRVGGQFEAISKKMHKLVLQGADPAGPEGQRKGIVGYHRGFHRRRYFHTAKPCQVQRDFG